MNRTANLRLLRVSGITLAAIIIISYAIWRSLNYARGPKIDIFEPVNGSSIASTTIVIKGRAERSNSLDLNGQTVSVDEQGNFSETLILFPGVNVITLDAKDQFGRSTETKLELVGTAELPKSHLNTSPAGTSTGTSTE